MEALADALESNELSLSSTVGAVQQALSIPGDRILPFLKVLRAGTTKETALLVLRSAAASASVLRAEQPQIEVAWTFPGDVQPGTRTTGGVACEIIEEAKHSLLVVGYSVTVDPQRIGLAARTIAAIADSASRGVHVTAVLHRSVDRDKLMQAWHPGVPPPIFFTWPEQVDPMASIHAKVVVADKRDVLVGSANLTYHGFEGNLEMGVRIKGGRAAYQIEKPILDLIRLRVLRPWPFPS